MGGKRVDELLRNLYLAIYSNSGDAEMKTVTITSFVSTPRSCSPKSEVNTLLVLRDGTPIAEISPPPLPRGENPSWKRPGLRLAAKGANLSAAIPEERGPEAVP